MNIGSITDLTIEEVKKVAIGIPESVPAGSYAQEAQFPLRLILKLIHLLNIQSELLKLQNIAEMLKTFMRTYKRKSLWISWLSMDFPYRSDHAGPGLE